MWQIMIYLQLSTFAFGLSHFRLKFETTKMSPSSLRPIFTLSRRLLYPLAFKFFRLCEQALPNFTQFVSYEEST